MLLRLLQPLYDGPFPVSVITSDTSSEQASVSAAGQRVISLCERLGPRWGIPGVHSGI